MSMLKKLVCVDMYLSGSKVKTKKKKTTTTIFSKVQPKTFLAFSLSLSFVFTPPVFLSIRHTHTHTHTELLLFRHQFCSFGQSHSSSIYNFKHNQSTDKAIMSLLSDVCLQCTGGLTHILTHTDTHTHLVK